MREDTHEKHDLQSQFDGMPYVGDSSIPWTRLKECRKPCISECIVDRTLRTASRQATVAEHVGVKSCVMQLALIDDTAVRIQKVM